ncbi:MAG: TRAP transporter large permease [Oscillospiraceae bacterium]|nr:TRAP transporter large permease [Oscillospiraceae bacterium]
MTALILFASLVILLCLGTPIAVSLAASSIITVLATDVLPVISMGQKFFTSIDSFTLMAIPFFMLAGALMSSGGISRRLVNLCKALFGWLPGGMGVVTVFACMFFGAVSGSPTATAAAIGSIMVPALLAEGYSMGFALATVASAGVLGCIIPPSAVMINYASVSNASVGALFAGGIMPGVVMGIFQSAICVHYGIKHKIPRTKFNLPQLGKAFVQSIGALLMPIIILGGIYTGIFTPTESAAVACVYGFIVGKFVYRELSFKEIYNIGLSSSASSGMIMFIVAAAGLFGFMMATESIPATVAEFMLGISNSKIVFLLLINLLLLIVGCFLETTAAVLILGPILVPILPLYDINLVHFGLIMVLNLTVGMLTPPLGVNLFVASSIQKQPVEAVINKHLAKYIIVMIITTLIITFVPEIVMVIPNLIA